MTNTDVWGASQRLWMQRSANSISSIGNHRFKATFLCPKENSWRVKKRKIVEKVTLKQNKKYFIVNLGDCAVKTHQLYFSCLLWSDLCSGGAVAFHYLSLVWNLKEKSLLNLQQTKTWIVHIMERNYGLYYKSPAVFFSIDRNVFNAWFASD